MIAAPTVGDPEAMRALAKVLTARAEVIASSVNVVSCVDTITFEGPAARRLRGAVADSRRQVLTCAGELRLVAARLMADATKVELQNRQLQLAAEREAAQAERDAREQQQDAPAGEPADDAAASVPAVPTSDQAATPAQPQANGAA